jgi:hypothetical protein
VENVPTTQKEGTDRELSKRHLHLNNKKEDENRSTRTKDEGKDRTNPAMSINE